MNSVEVESIMTFKRELLNARSRFRRDEYWTIYNSPISSYEKTFSRVLDGKKFADLLRQKPHPTVVDLMAPSNTLADLFGQLPQSGKLGIALSLEDLRGKVLKDRDAALGIKQISGDITRPKTWRALQSALEGRKADLIMERAVSGLADLPQDKRFYSYVMDNLWNMLDINGGILVLATPFDIRLNVKIAWIDLLKSQGIIAEFDGGGCLGGCLRLVRTPESLRNLPSVVGLHDKLPFLE